MLFAHSSRTKIQICTDDRGSISIIAALFLTVAIGAAALAVDLGSIYLERRDAQGAVDLAALAAAADITHAEAAVTATLAANKVARIGSVTVTRGRYDAGSGVAPANRFTPGASPANAVQVSLIKDGEIFFAKSFLPARKAIGVRAVAATSAQATFSVGSRLASVNGGLGNQVLGALVGGNVALKAMDYNALIDGNVRIQGFLDALAGELGVTAGTYGDVLDSHAALGSVITAAAKSTQADGQSAASAALALVGQSVAPGLQVPLRGLVDLGPMANVSLGESNPGLGGSVNAMSFVTAAAGLANGNHQVAIDAGLALPGVSRISIELAIGEPAQHSGWIAVGQRGAEVTTAQTRLKLTAEIGGSGLLAGATVRLPIYLDLAAARARLDAVTCSADGASTATIAARPSLVRAWIGSPSGSIADFGSDRTVIAGDLVRTALVSVTGRAEMAASNTSDTALDFTSSDVANHVVKTVETHDAVETLVSSLVSSLDLTASVGGIGLGTPALLKAAVRNVLQPAAAPLDELLGSVLSMLGVHLGEADISVHGIRCGGAVLTG